MSLDNLQFVDVLGLDTVTGEVVLTILDSWDWLDETEHLMALQTKLNNYLDFIENGEVFVSNPDWRGMKCRIDVIMRFAPTVAAVEFLQIATRYCESMHVPLTHRVDAETSKNQEVYEK